MASDADLLTNILSNRSPGFAEMYDRYGDSIYRYALMTSGSVSTAEEVTQETFVHMIEHADRYSPDRSDTALGWLYGIARNKIRSLQLHDRRKAPLVDAQSNRDSPERRFGWSRMAEEMAIAILGLPMSQREVIVLCGVQEMDYESAADALNLPIGTIRSRLSRARNNLRRSLAEVGYALEEIKLEAQ